MMSGINKKDGAVVMIILDGAGYSPDQEHNAIAIADTPNLDRVGFTSPKSLLKTSGAAVGLPDGQMGNSEVGHKNIGAGRVTEEDFVKINNSIKNGEYGKSKAIVAHLDRMEGSDNPTHVIGLISKGGVHGHVNHLLATVEELVKKGQKVEVHGISDGRDVPPESILKDLPEFLKELDKINDEFGGGKELVQLASLQGRGQIMDRDRRWQERIEPAYNAIISAEGIKTDDFMGVIKGNFQTNEKKDEFIPQIVRSDYSGAKDGDGLIITNFRSDRAKQIAKAILAPDFQEFDRAKAVNFVSKVAMSEYADDVTPLFDNIVFHKEEITNTIGEVVSRGDIQQLRLAETEKYAHVTCFMNGNTDEIYGNETRILVPSPRDVDTYDKKPEMAAEEVTDELVKAIKSREYGLIIVNYANGDMVGHTGDKGATTAAIEAMDTQLGRVFEVADKQDAAILMFADHGNAEQMVDDKGNPHTQHTTTDVPFIGYNLGKGAKLESGQLSDVAPTALTVMKEKFGYDVEIPRGKDGMTGKVLVSWEKNKGQEKKENTPSNGIKSSNIALSGAVVATDNARAQQ